MFSASACTSSTMSHSTFFNKEMNEVEAIRGKDPPFWKNLGIIPSPYLTGVMDEFFNQTLIPQIETDRGCPYPCKFCAWGKMAYQKIEVFPEDRVVEELNYIAHMVNKTRKTTSL